jgi:hypothetical protein
MFSALRAENLRELERLPVSLMFPALRAENLRELESSSVLYSPRDGSRLVRLALAWCQVCNDRM